SREFLNVVGTTLKNFGYRVRINDPYKGVEIVRRHGRPDLGRNSLQIEINRALYMNEGTFERKPYYATLKSHMAKLVEVVGDYALERTGAKAAE
ncbi:MAG: N-formylglutamate amidohydrolase, partial [Pseudomonadota bacterium]|nr:N-formylglutamate amidohydrolase [Pseudomonadota bacterium]